LSAAFRASGASGVGRGLSINYATNAFSKDYKIINCYVFGYALIFHEHSFFL